MGEDDMGSGEAEALQASCEVSPKALPHTQDLGIPALCKILIRNRQRIGYGTPRWVGDFDLFL